MKTWFKEREIDAIGTSYPLEEVLAQLNFTEEGLIPVIAQDEDSKEVVMFAWMNLEALQDTLNKGYMCYWSRSRNTLWRKGESSGHIQEVVSLKTDCDGDVLLAQIKQKGAACHTMRRSCFYLEFQDDKLVIIDDPIK